MRAFFYKQISVAVLAVVMVMAAGLLAAPKVSATKIAADGGGGSVAASQSVKPTACGGGPDNSDPGQNYPSYTPSINIGCKGQGNPIADAAFAIIRWLSDGVGVVVIGSIIVAGIQYTTAQADPQAVAKAVGRIRSSLFALLLYIFSYAILNYIIPGQVLR